MVRKVKEPLDEAYLLPIDRIRREMNTKLKSIPVVRLEYPAAPSRRAELRIGYEIYKGSGYVDLRLWLLSLSGKWHPTGRGVTLSPFYVLAGVVEALKQVPGGGEFWIQKGRPGGAPPPDVISVVLKRVGGGQFVDVRTLTIKPGGYTATEKRLTIPVNLLGRVIEGLERFARAVGDVDSKYLRPLRLVEAPDR